MEELAYTLPTPSKLNTSRSFWRKDLATAREYLKQVYQYQDALKGGYCTISNFFVSQFNKNTPAEYSNLGYTLFRKPVKGFSDLTDTFSTCEVIS
ncbi:hypothetical protein CEXT_158831 [Caerostris extrusa]|uniref:Uncharacterized protein n=1 Tax=Caerostris extrusa TaxID=172846 RepID=A0AAV4PX38_CAEEX|nr:hypothetical protein CEXT_158831 [Caerostris extrusa]